MEIIQKSVRLDYSKIRAEQEKFFKEIFNLETDFSGIRIPAANDNIFPIFPWFICVPETKLLSNEQAFNGGKPQIKVWKFTDESLDDVLNISFGRDKLTEPYIVRCRANYEADEDLKNISANRIAELNIDTLTLKERLLLGKFIYWKENKLLDQKTITLCSGSRCVGGDVPIVYWFDNDDRLKLRWRNLSLERDVLRARRAVS